MEYLSLIPTFIGLGASLLNMAGGVLTHLPTPSTEHVKPSYHQEKLRKVPQPRKRHFRHVKKRFHLSADITTEGSE